MYMAAIQAAIYNLHQKRGQLHLKSFVSNDKLIQNPTNNQRKYTENQPFFWFRYSVGVTP